MRCATSWIGIRNRVRQRWVNIRHTIMITRTARRIALKMVIINLMLALLLFGLVLMNKTIFRSAFPHSQFAQILTWSFPNFIAGLLLCLCVVNPVLIKKPKRGRTIVYAISLLIMSVLIADEAGSVVASAHYDNNDIIGIALGSILAVIMFEYLYYRQHVKIKNLDHKKNPNCCMYKKH